MTFITARDLRLKAAELWALLKVKGEVVVTVNGRPQAIITSTSPELLEESLITLKRLRAQTAVAKMRAFARSKITPDIIKREIKAARKKRK